MTTDPLPSMTPEQREHLEDDLISYRSTPGNDGATASARRAAILGTVDAMMHAYARAAVTRETERCVSLCHQMAAQFPGNPTPRSVALELAENIGYGTTEIGGRGTK